MPCTLPAEYGQRISVVALPCRLWPSPLRGRVLRRALLAFPSRVASVLPLVQARKQAGIGSVSALVIVIFISLRSVTLVQRRRVCVERLVAPRSVSMTRLELLSVPTVVGLHEGLPSGRHAPSIALRDLCAPFSVGLAILIFFWSTLRVVWPCFPASPIPKYDPPARSMMSTDFRSAARHSVSDGDSSGLRAWSVHADR